MTKRRKKTRIEMESLSNRPHKEEEDFCFEEEDYIYIERKNQQLPQYSDKLYLSFHFEKKHVLGNDVTNNYHKQYDIKNDKIIASYEIGIAYEGPPPTKDEEKELFQAKCQTRHCEDCCCNIIWHSMLLKKKNI